MHGLSLGRISFLSGVLISDHVGGFDPIQARGLHARADRLLLPGEAGQPDEEDIPLLAEVCGAGIEITQDGVNGMKLTYGQVGSENVGSENVKHIERSRKATVSLTRSGRNILSVDAPIHGSS